jgi:aspartate/methionine/tyrosine aminotransferase
VKLEMKSRIAKRMQGIHGEAAFQMLGRATELERQGRSIIHLEIGEPDFDTPDPIVRAGIEWLKKGATHYSPVPGVWDLRTAIARHLSSEHPTKIDPGNILVTPGAKMMIFSIIQSIVDPGDEVICPDPSYPAYEAAIRMAGATPVRVKLEESKQFRFDLDQLARQITPRTKLITINSPQNPTGGVLTLDDLKKVADLARKHDLLILSDEIYSEIYYTDRPPSILDVPNILDRVFVVNGFSKIYAMTGWRLGYGIFPPKLYEYVRKLAVNLHSCVNASAQYAGLAALKGPQDEVHRMIAEFDKRRKVVVAGLNKLPGVSCATPKGAFYAFPNVKKTGWKAKELATALLDNTGVATIGGPDFGILGEGYIRLSYANSTENILKALARMGEFLASRKAA